METDSSGLVFDGREQQTFRVSGPWRNGPRHLIVSGGRVVASDHRPWVGFEWGPLSVRLHRPGVRVRRVEPLIDTEGRTPVWLSLEELHILTKAIRYLLDHDEGLDEDTRTLAGETYMEIKRVAVEVEARMIRNTYTEAEERRAESADAEGRADGA